jgi:hypothetical protein
MVLIAGNITGTVVKNGGGIFFIFIPDRRSFAILMGGTLNLITCSCRTPDEILGEVSLGHHNFFFLML